MRTLSLFIILSFSICGFAQKTRIGLSYQPGISYYTVQTDLTGLSQDFKLLNKPLFANQTGFVVYSKVSSGVTFSAGVLYATRGIRSQFNTSNIQAFNFSNTYNDVKLTDRYIEVPVNLHIYFSNSGSVNWFAAFGLKPSLYLQSVRKVVGTEEITTYHYAAHRKINVFATIGVGADIPLNKQLSLVIWPSVDHALISEVFASPLKLYPYSAGLNLCLLYSLGN